MQGRHLLWKPVWKESPSQQPSGSREVLKLKTLQEQRSKTLIVRLYLLSKMPSEWMVDSTLLRFWIDQEDGELPSKVQIEMGENYTQLSIDICDKFDAGKYILNLENSAGTKSAFVSVKVLDTPGPPLQLVVRDIKRESVTLNWEPPIIDGGSRIKNYLVEKRESTRKVFSNVDNKCTKTSYRVTGLTEGTIYYFRVLAENEFGVGQPTVTEQPVKASEPPLPVGKVTLTEVTKTTTSLSWEKPDHDGGSRIIGYYIEMQPVGSEEWVLAATTKTCEGTVNLSGSKSAFINVRVLDSPSAPTNLEVKDVKRNSVSLSWEPPLIDGGAKISHYIVEKREQKRMAFTSVCTNCVRNSYIVSDLQEGGRYYFRVLAVNELGVGLPASTDQVKVSEAPLPPGKFTLHQVCNGYQRARREHANRNQKGRQFLHCKNRPYRNNSQNV
uniref:Fibronectin type-III domain-containing protein n=1 Tax=Oryzias sinensis TaxID=183150 RepID=A0A8C7YGU1_9TELE